MNNQPSRDKKPPVEPRQDRPDPDQYPGLARRIRERHKRDFVSRARAAITEQFQRSQRDD